MSTRESLGGYSAEMELLRVRDDASRKMQSGRIIVAINGFKVKCTLLFLVSLWVGVNINKAN